MKHTKTALNGNFGLCLDNVTCGDLEDQDFQTEAYDLWASHGGLLVVRGEDLAELSPETRRPVWHTDSTFRQNPPIGSVFHCRIAPPEGSETLFADTRGANIENCKGKNHQ